MIKVKFCINRQFIYSYIWQYCILRMENYTVVTFLCQILHPYWQMGWVQEAPQFLPCGQNCSFSQFSFALKVQLGRADYIRHKIYPGYGIANEPPN